MDVPHPLKVNVLNSVVDSFDHTPAVSFWRKGVHLGVWLTHVNITSCVYRSCWIYGALRVSGCGTLIHAILMARKGCWRLYCGGAINPVLLTLLAHITVEHITVEHIS